MCSKSFKPGVHQPLNPLPPSRRTSLVNAPLIKPIPGAVCKFGHAYLDVTKRNIWVAAGAPNFFSFTIIISDICENLTYVAPPRQILYRHLCSTSTSNFIALFWRQPSDALFRALWNSKNSECPLISSKIVCSWWNLMKRQNVHFI